MKNIYLTPEMEVIEFEADDIVTLSEGGSDVEWLSFEVNISQY